MRNAIEDTKANGREATPPDTRRISMSIDEASDESGIGKTKLYEAINAGILKAKKFGKRTIILRSELEAFLTGLPSYANSSKEIFHARRR